MSSLICYSTEDFAIIATDTLGVSHDGSPFILTNKATFLPTLKTVICGTGAGGFHSRWAEYVNSRMVLLGIDNLDYHTPDLLREMWLKYKREFSSPEDLTVTVYHIGFSLFTSKIKQFAYRSTDDFKSQEIPNGWFYKPECSTPDGEEILDVIKAMMFEQRAIQDAKPASERVYIGGQINAIILEANCVRHMTIADFPDVIGKLFNN